MLVRLFLLGFVICNFGENVTSHYSDLNNEIYNLSWHLCSLKMQHSVKIMMFNAQQPIYIEGFPKLRCTHETYTKVSYLSKSLMHQKHS